MKLVEAVYVLALVACFAGNSASISSNHGALVSVKSVVTTASCINYLEPTDIQVYLGSVGHYSDGYTFNVTDILSHPRFNSSTHDNNIAILTLATAIDFSRGTIQPISLATALPPVNSILTATVYRAANPSSPILTLLGSIRKLILNALKVVGSKEYKVTRSTTDDGYQVGESDQSLTFPYKSQNVYLQAFSKTQCRVYKNNKLTASMFCAGDPAGERDLCPADQGAPASYQMYENGKMVTVLFGIYSWGCSCGLSAPGPSSPVFTSIPYFQDWIQSNINTPVSGGVVNA